MAQEDFIHFTGLDINCGGLTPAGGAHARAKNDFSSGFGAANFVFTTP